MAEQSLIGWTGATWNPLVGCSLASGGCRGCYAMEEAWRKMHHPHPAVAAKFAGTAMKVKGRAVWTGQVNFWPPALLMPIKRRAPQIYFVNSLSDLFHKNVAAEVIDRILAVTVLCPQHIFQVLTKRDRRMREYLTFPGAAARIWMAAARLAAELKRPAPGPIEWPLRNVWLGVSTENQRWADQRIPNLLASPAAVRFISAEPLLGPIDLNSTLGGTLWLGGQRGCGGMHRGSGSPDCPRELHHHHDERCGRGLDWVITGGKSGKGPQPPHPDWFRSLRDQCAAAGTPFFFKQWGSCLPAEWDIGDTGPCSQGLVYEVDEAHCSIDYDDLGRGRRIEAHGLEFVHFHHSRTGNLLDGKVHEAMPAGVKVPA